MHKSLILLVGLALAGCVTNQTPPEPEAPLTLAQWCKRGWVVLGYRSLDPAQKAGLLELMRNRGCMNPDGGLNAAPST